MNTISGITGSSRTKVVKATVAKDVVEIKIPKVDAESAVEAGWSVMDKVERGLDFTRKLLVCGAAAVVTGIAGAIPIIGLNTAKAAIKNGAKEAGPSTSGFVLTQYAGQVAGLTLAGAGLVAAGMGFPTIGSALGTASMVSFGLAGLGGAALGLSSTAPILTKAWSEQDSDSATKQRLVLPSD